MLFHDLLRRPLRIVVYRPDFQIQRSLEIYELRSYESFFWHSVLCGVDDYTRISDNLFFAGECHA